MESLANVNPSRFGPLNRSGEAPRFDTSVDETDVISL